MTEMGTIGLIFAICVFKNFRHALTHPSRKGENFCNFPRKCGIFPPKLANFVPILPKIGLLAQFPTLTVQFSEVL